jgi:hypothetical protein
MRGATRLNRLLAMFLSLVLSMPELFPGSRPPQNARSYSRDLLTFPWVSLLHVWVSCLGCADARVAFSPISPSQRAHLGSGVKGWPKAIAKRREALSKRAGGAP